MATIHGQAIGAVVPQSDFSARKNENGGWTASQSFQILKGDLDNYGVRVKFPGGATLRSLDPNCDNLFASLRLTKITSVQTVEGGWTRITAEFVGFQSEDGDSTVTPPIPDPIPTYAKRGSLSEAPITEHPKWKALSDPFKFALGELLSGNAQVNHDGTQIGEYQISEFVSWGLSFVPLKDGSDVDITLTGDAIKFAQYIGRGVTTYKFATYEYTHRWEDNVGISATQMNDLGKISTPSGSPPKPGTDRDWLLVGVDEEQYGSGNFRFTNSMTYLLSDEGGHDSFLQS